jgi:hypothetical protein
MTTPIIAAAAYILLSQPGAIPMDQPALNPPLFLPIDCLAPAQAAKPPSGHISVRWVGAREYYDRHHRHHGRHRRDRDLEDEPTGHR